MSQRITRPDRLLELVLIVSGVLTAIAVVVMVIGLHHDQATAVASKPVDEPTSETTKSAKPVEPMLLRFFLQCGTTELDETMWGCYTGHDFAVWAPDDLAQDSHAALIQLMRRHKNYDPQTDSIFEVGNPDRGVLWLHGRRFLGKARTLASPYDAWDATIVDTDH